MDEEIAIATALKYYTWQEKLLCPSGEALGQKKKYVCLLSHVEKN